MRDEGKQLVFYSSLIPPPSSLLSDVLDGLQEFVERVLGVAVEHTCRGFL
jgi:hypothetical protein